MRNLTVKVQDKTYREIRVWCARRDTCISHVVRAFLNDLTHLPEVDRFPLPEAPDPRSLGARFNQLHSEEAEEIGHHFDEMDQNNSITVSLCRAALTSSNQRLGPGRLAQPHSGCAAGVSRQKTVP